MGTTSRGFPYPGGSDFVIDGDDAMEALAEALDAYHGQFAVLARSSVQSIPDALSTYIEWTPGSSNMSDAFELSGDNKHLYYNGPGRFLLVVASVTWPSQSDSNPRTANVSANGGLSNGNIGSTIDLSSYGFGSTGHALTQALLLDDGGYIDVTVGQFTGSAQNCNATLRVVAL